jgi:hypothetical protein
MNDVFTSTGLTRKDAFELYENGKHRRYSLLFAVNGGAFTIAKLLSADAAQGGMVLGDLTLAQLSLGLMAFTAVMVWDIYAFGEKMRKAYLDDAFGSQGKIVLFLLGALLFTGWLLVGVRQVP